MNCEPFDHNGRRPVTERRAAPQRAWVCGYAELGKCCAPGPTRDGRCGRSTSGKPHDNAADASDADAAFRDFPEGRADDESTVGIDDELPPCVPRRNHVVRRQVLGLNLAILTGGVLLMSMSLPSREKHFVPGELSSKHAQILENTLVSERCSLCHSNSHAETPISFAHSGLFGADRGLQDALCMQCHKGHMPNASARSPHDLSSEMWQALAATKDGSAAWRPVGHQSVAQDSKALETQQTNCAACHIEHHGREFDLKKMADDRCQSCHRRKFESLSSGHPEFVNFPAERPRAITFSHQDHADKHFPQKSRDFDCRQCHVDATGTTAVGQISRTVTFDKACAGCHNQPIGAAIADGWALLQLPSIEANAAEKGSGLEHWPRDARFGFEGVIPPVLRALLAADADAQSALARVPLSGQLAEITAIDQSRAEVTKTLARATEKLIVDTAREGQAAWRSRLEKVTRAKLGRELSDNDKRLIDAMCTGLPPDLFRNIQAEWFRDASSVVGKKTAQSSSIALVSSTDDDLLLTESPEDDALLNGAADSEPDHADSEPDDAKPIKGATHVSGGGWYVDHQTLAVRYMPTGHADSTLAAWSLWWCMIESAASAEAEPAILATDNSPLSKAVSRQIPGNCVECHQVRTGGSHASLEPWSPAGAWKISKPLLSQKEFTKFNHAPHLTLPAVDDCRYCHVLPNKPSYKTKLGTTERLVSLPGDLKTVQHGSEFQKMHLAQCVACHRPDGASAGCLQCHNYHITSPVQQPAAQPLSNR